LPQAVLSARFGGRDVVVGWVAVYPVEEGGVDVAPPGAPSCGEAVDDLANEVVTVARGRFQHWLSYR